MFKTISDVDKKLKKKVAEAHQRVNLCSEKKRSVAGDKYKGYKHRYKRGKIAKMVSGA